VIEEATGAARPLYDLGFDTADARAQGSFGSGLLALHRGDVQVRVVCDRGDWFVEIGSLASPDEWFDARLVLQELGVAAIEMGVDYGSLKRLCSQLAAASSEWEPLFQRANFAEARPSFRAREIAQARELFGPIDDLEDGSET
jgi:hypothetical protein